MIVHDRTRLIGRLSFWVLSPAAATDRCTARGQERGLAANAPQKSDSVLQILPGFRFNFVEALNLTRVQPAPKEFRVSKPRELEGKLWKALGSDRVVMLGLDGAEDGHTRPMTVQVEGEKSPLWVFTSKDNQMVKLLRTAQRATATFTAKGHDLFASLQGTLHHHNDRATIDRLWNRFVAAWYEGGKEDPNLALLRFDATHAEIWENQNSLIAGVKMLLGEDPKKDAHDKVAHVNLRQETKARS